MSELDEKHNAQGEKRTKATTPKGPDKRRRELKREAKKRLEGTEDRLAQKARAKLFAEATVATLENVFEHLEAEHPDWDLEALAWLPGYAFAVLRDTIESPDEPVSWEEPVREIRFPVVLSGEYQPIPESPPDLLEPEDLTDKTWERLRRALKSGKPDPLAEKFARAALDFAQDALLLQVFQNVTQGAGYLKEGDEYVPGVRWDEPRPPEGPEERVRAFWDKVCKPFTLSAPGEKTRAELSGTVTDEAADRELPFKCTLLLAVHPLVLDVDNEAAFYPVSVGLVFEGEAGDPSTWAEVDRGALWDLVTEACEQLAQALRKGEKGETPTTETLLPKAPSVTEPPLERRFLPSGSTRIDKQTAALVAHASGFAGLPRSWKSVVRWEDLVQGEIERLLEQEEELAFQDLRRATGDPNARGPLLKKRRKGSGEELVSLTSEAERDLLDTVGTKWLRRTRRDPDGQVREYLEKRLRAKGGGYLTARFSWYGRAWPLVEEGRSSQAHALEGVRERLRQGLLFERLTEQEQETLDSGLRFMGALKDAYKVMECILAELGSMGENPVRLPAWRLWSLLECENSNDRHRRVRGCLQALQEFRFEAEGAVFGRLERVTAPFLGEVRFVGRGPGAHTDGDFFLSVSPAFVGSLEVFGSSRYKRADGRNVLRLDFSGKLSKEDRAELGRRGGFISGSVLAPYWDRAHGLSPQQANLRRWVEHNLTLKRDSVQRTRKNEKVKPSHPEANEPRLYGREFCPLIPEGSRYCGALGHFKRNPEVGRSLYGRLREGTKTGGRHTEGLLEVMGYPLPRGGAKIQRAETYRKALVDLGVVVERAFGGLAVARLKRDHWLTLEQASKLPEAELKKASWYLFVPPDYRKRMEGAVEDYQAKRHARGETPYLVQVEESRGGPDIVPPEDEAGPDALPLHVRLYQARRERRLTQADVARLFGVSRVMVAKWERGTEPDEEGRVRGKPISRELAPRVDRWVRTGKM